MASGLPSLKSVVGSPKKTPKGSGPQQGLPTLKSLVGGGDLPSLKDLVKTNPHTGKTVHHGGGGGLLHQIAHAVEQGGTDLKNVALNAPGGVVKLGEDTGVSVYNQFRHPLRVPHGGKHDPLTNDLKAQGKQVKKDLSHPLRHPGLTLLDVLPAANLAGKLVEAGALARAGEGVGTVAKAATVGAEPGVRVLKVGDLEARGHYSRAAGARVVQRATDKALEKGAKKGVGVAVGKHEVSAESLLHGRAAKWLARNERVADAQARAPGTRLQVLGQKLKPEELRALRLVAEEAPVERRLAAQQLRQAGAKSAKETARHQERIDLTQKAMKFLDTAADGKPVLKPAATKLAKVYDALKAASTDRESMLKNIGLMDDAAIEASKTKTARIAAGGSYVEPTAAKLGEASQPLLAARARVARLESLHARATAKAEEKAVPYENVHTRTGYVKQNLKTAPEAALKRQHVEVTPGPKTPGEPSALPPKGINTPSVERLGGALSVARDELARLEERSAARAQPTGVVGADDITASPEAVHIGNPVERTKLAGKPKVSSTGTFGHTRKPGSLKTATGGAVEHALERNDVTNIVAERHAEAVRLSKVDRVRQNLARAGSPVPRRRNDVFVWTDDLTKNERIPDEVRKYLDNPESVAQLPEHERVSMTEKLRQAVFQQHDWQVDAESRQKFEQLAHEGRGVFVPRKLAGDAAKREITLPGSGFVDAVNNAQKAGLIYLKVNYPVVQGLSNVAMNLIHQGFAAPARLTQAVRLDHAIGPDLSAVVDDVMGQGAITQAAFEGKGAASRASQKLADVMSSGVDRPARRAAFLHEAAKAGYSDGDRLKELLTDDSKAGDLAEVAQRAKEAIVDYGELGPTERGVIRRLIFVYPWQKGATKYAAHFLRDHPNQAAVLGNAGDLGQRQSEKDFGPLASYLQGGTKIRGGFVNPSGLNFFQTPAQIGESLGGLATGNPSQASSGLGFLSPAPALLAGLLSGQDDIGRQLNGNALAKARDLTAGQTPAAALLYVLSGGRTHAVFGGRGPSKSFPGQNDAMWKFLLGGLYPRQYNQGALNRNAAFQKLGR